MQAKINTRIVALIVAAGAFGVTLQAQADCAGASVQDVKRRYANAQQLDKAGKLREALGAYAAATEYTCEANPVAAPAAKRAAEIALPLGQEAEKKKDYEVAFVLYGDGGHYAASDRALMSLVRSSPDDPSVFTRARETFQYRSSEAFQSNNQVQLKAAGAYTFDQKNLEEVLRMPAIGVDRALKAEMTAWNEQYLRELADQIQTRPEDLTDMAAVQRYSASQQAFAQKWPNDLLKQSRDSLGLAWQWANVANDEALTQKVNTQRAQRIEMRVNTLTKSFNRAPSLLDAAIDYQMLQQQLDDTTRALKAKSIRQQAALLGDQAQAQKRYLLASDYFRVARLDDKAQAAQELSRQGAMAKMQPSIDQAQQQAEAMKAAFSDPEKVKQMQEQARAAQKAIQAQQQANAKSNAKKADDLEKELGL